MSVLVSVEEEYVESEEWSKVMPNDDVKESHAFIIAIQELFIALTLLKVDSNVSW